MSAAAATKPRAPKAEAAAEPMRLTVNRGDLLRALGHAAAIVERRNTIPVLSNVLLEASGGALKVTSTDLNLQIALTVPAAIEGEGAITVPASLLHGIVRELPDGCQVELKLDETRLQVISGRSRYKLSTLAAEQFPVLVRKDTTAELELPAGDLLRAFRRVEFAQGIEETRYYLMGVHIDVRDGDLVFAACDGNLLAWSKLEAPDGADNIDVILPSKLVATLGKLLDGHEDAVKLTFEEGKVVVDLGDTVLASKLVDGTFPDWRRVIPAAKNKLLKVDTVSLGDALRRVALIAMEKTRLAKIELSADKLTISCTSPENGLAVEELPCAWDADEMEVGVNTRQFASALAAMDCDELEIAFTDPATPILLTDPGDDSHHAVVTLWRV